MPTLVNIDTAKEQVLTYQPLLLVTIALANGSTLYLSTHAVTYSGNTYNRRLLDMQLGAVQGQDGQGISVPSNLTLKCADADAELYNNVESPIGFKGATCTLTFLYFDLVSGEFSPDNIVKFIGRCGSPQVDDKTLTIGALNFYNLAPYNLPALQIQALCPWIFPATAALQEAAANGTNQQSKECPYNPSGTTTPRGNLDPSTSQPYFDCPKTKAGCQARGGYNGDNMSRQTGWYGGVQFNPPTSSVSRSYETGKYQQILNNGPEAKYGDVVPLMYGEGWASCKVLNSWPDANYWRGEVLISYGLVGQVLMVLVNGVEIPHTYGDGIFASTAPGFTDTADLLKLGYWGGVNNGSVYSQPSLFYAAKSDPYGSLAVIYVQVVVDIAAANSTPNVQVLLQGQQVRVYSTPTAYTYQFSSNPWWIIMDLLTWANLEYSQLDIAGFIREAAFADQGIPYVNQYGQSGTHPRFSFTLSLTQGNTADQTLRSCLNAVRGFLVPNYVGGLLSPRTNKTLADQQPSAVDGSNYNSAVPSFRYDGTPTSGYLAYYFAEGTIAETDSGDTTLRISQAQIQQAPNRLGFVFQDSENNYNQDSVQITDDEDIAITGQVINGNISINGPNTYDHGQRLIATKLAEGYRGNTRLALDGETIGDTRGTLTVYFQTSHRVVKLNMGDIVALDSVKYGFSLADYLSSSGPAPFFRVQKIEPTSNYERVTVTATLHNDGWYLDTFGQTGAPLWTSGWRSPNLLGARPLTELGIAAIAYSTNGGSLNATLTMKVAPGVNVPAGSLQPPYVPLQALSATTGGTIPCGQMYYVCIVAISSAGWSAPSLLTRVFIAAGGTNTNTVTVNNLYWDAATTAFAVYAGTHPAELSLQSGNYSTSGGTSAQPATITITSALIQAGELPDNKLSFIRFKQKRVSYPGIWTGLLSSASISGGVWTLGISVGGGTPFGTNALVGRQVALLGRAASTEADIFPLTLPSSYPTLTITANTASTLTVSGDSTGLAAFAAGDQITIRIQATLGSDGTGNYLEDLLFVNPNSTGIAYANLYTGGFPLLRIVAGTGTGYTAMIQNSATGLSLAPNTATRVYIYGAWPVATDSSSIFVIEYPTWDNIFDTGTIYNDGNLGVIPYTMNVSAYAGQTILVQAVSVGADGTESSSVAAPVREAYLLTTAQTDTGDPPTPAYSLVTDNRGQIILQSVGFATGATNFNTVTSGTLALYSRDLANTSSIATLSGSVTSGAGSITFTSSVSYPLGQALLVDNEIVICLTGSGATYSVVRAALGSTGASHTAGALVYPLTQNTYTPAFPPLFFAPSNAAAQSVFQYPIPLPRHIVSASQFLVTNSLGPSMAAQQCYAAVAGGGISTGASGNAAITLTVYGTIGIGSNQAPRYQTSSLIQPSAIIALLAEGPVGSTMTVNINVGGTLWLSLTIPSVSTSSTPSSVSATSAQIAALTAIPTFTDVSIDITGVGSSYPGGALTIQVFA